MNAVLARQTGAFVEQQGQAGVEQAVRAFRSRSVTRRSASARVSLQFVPKSVGRIGPRSGNAGDGRRDKGGAGKRNNLR